MKVAVLLWLFQCETDRRGRECLSTRSWLSNSNAARGSTQNTGELYIFGSDLNGLGSPARRPERLQSFKKKTKHTHRVNALAMQGENSVARLGRTAVWSWLSVTKYQLIFSHQFLSHLMIYLFPPTPKKNCKSSRLSEWMLCLSLIPLCKHGLLTQLPAVHVRPASLRRSVQCA